MSDEKLSRRSVLSGFSAGVLTATAAHIAVACGNQSDANAQTDPDGGPPGTAVDASSMDSALPPATVDVDVVIVGAGLTGLNAANMLVKAGKTVHVIEADTRVGGRIWSERTNGGVTIDWGAHFVGPQQTRILALTDQLGIKRYPTYNTGSNVQYFGGVRSTYEGTTPILGPLALLEAQGMITQLDTMASTLDPAMPWAAANAEEWDSQTFWSWSRANASTPGALKLLDLAVQALLSVESRDVSLLYLLFYIRSAGSLESLINTAGGAQDAQLDGGTQQLPERLAAQIPASALTVNSPVRRIETANGSVTVISSLLTVRAKRVIVAVPPPMVPRIVFNPPLSGRKDQLYQHMPMGSIGKAIAIYDKPFWRDQDLTGQVTSDVGPVRVTFDVSPLDNSSGVLLGFIDGQDARDFEALSTDMRRDTVLAQFATWFGDAAKTPREYRDLVWASLPLHRGCPVAVPGPGVMVGFKDALRSSEGAIHFASTETATQWSGYMEGALQAGEAVAQAVLAAIS